MAQQNTSGTTDPPEAASEPTTGDCGRTIERRAPPPVNFKATESLISEYIGTNGNAEDGGDAFGDDDEFWSFRNMLYFQAGNRDFDSSMRIDTTLFHNPPAYVDPLDFVSGGNGYTVYNYDNDFRIERIYGKVTLGNFKLIAGDFYVNFGRGMALSLVKQDDAGVDNTLRGARVEYAIPRKLKAILVGGVVNASNIDVLTHQVQRDDPLDKIAGARLEWEALDALSLGAHGVFLQPRFKEDTDIAYDRIYVDQSPGMQAINGGATAELHAGGLHVYLEGNGQVHSNYRPVEGRDDVIDESGYAAFGEVSYDLSPFNIKAEGIFYKRWLMDGPYRGSVPSEPTQAVPLPYHHLVTLEPKWMVIKSLGNAEGGRLTGDLYLKTTDTQLTLTTALIHYEGGLMPGGTWTDHPPTLVVHPIFKAVQIFGKTNIQATLEGGFRYETTDEPEVEDEDNGTLAHVMADVALPITGPHSLEFKEELRRYKLHVTEGNEYWVVMTTLAYEWSGAFGLSLVHEYSDQTAGNVGSIAGWEIPLPRKHYLLANLNIHAPAPLDGLSLRILAGSQRGGFKCFGGVCREYPDLVGVKIDASYRF
ncbi:MAG: DUF6029 family protein [Myxococcota bacterium]|nr:DUF6029 family protein [Myxococcota bacterium]